MLRIAPVTLLLLACIAVACGRGAPAHTATAPPVSYDECLASVTRGYSCFDRVGKYGIRCSGYVAPGQTPNPATAPVSFPLQALGRPGVPTLSSEQRAIVAHIARKSGAQFLRFVLINGPYDLVVFDAPQGPCADIAPGYPVLNSSSSNEFYEPGENPFNTHAGPGF